MSTGDIRIYVLRLQPVGYDNQIWIIRLSISGQTIIYHSNLTQEYLSVSNKLFDLVTLTLVFGLLLFKNFKFEVLRPVYTTQLVAWILSHATQYYRVNGVAYDFS
jgi:hypothetical protein